MAGRKSSITSIVYEAHKIILTFFLLIWNLDRKLEERNGRYRLVCGFRALVSIISKFPLVLYKEKLQRALSDKKHFTQFHAHEYIYVHPDGQELCSLNHNNLLKSQPATRLKVIYSKNRRKHAYSEEFWLAISLCISIIAETRCILYRRRGLEKFCARPTRRNCSNNRPAIKVLKWRRCNHSYVKIVGGGTLKNTKNFMLLGVRFTLRVHFTLRLLTESKKRRGRSFFSLFSVLL